MFLEEKTYSVLVVSSSDKLNDSIDSLLPRSYYSPVTFVSSVAKAQRSLLEKSFDFIIINAPLPDDMGTRLAIDVCERGYSSCLMLLAPSLYEEVNAKVSSRGVFTLAKPLSATILQQCLKWMATNRERLRRFEKKEMSLDEKMAEIRTISRAKILLVEKKGMTENEAHKHIEKQSMDLCITKIELANRIIQEYQ